MIQAEWPHLAETLHPTLTKVFDKLYSVPSRVLAPESKDVFKALELSPPNMTKVVILGQDPYIKGEAHGLAFSSKLGMTPSLNVIFKELSRVGLARTNPNLTDWAKQGVLLLNTILTTRLGESLAHQSFGWQEFTKSILQYLLYLDNPLVIMLWGVHARNSWKEVVDSMSSDFDFSQIKVLNACHPVFESRSGNACFAGSNHFVLANEWLVAHNLSPIKWNDNE